MDRLVQQLRRIDGRGYPAYKDIRGTYKFDSFELEFIHIQGDPFAAPSQVAIRIPVKTLQIFPEDISTRSRRIGFEDAILRDWVRALNQLKRARGSGKSGLWGALRPGQEIMARSACEIEDRYLTLRFTVGLPAAGRRILGREAIEMLTRDLPTAVQRALFHADRKTWETHADSSEDQDCLRAMLAKKGWVAFIANGSILPRASGVDDRPLTGSEVLPWQSPPELETAVELPHTGTVKGSAIPTGITLICGGGYHGKSTVLEALARGIYNHVPNDGRELCITLYETVAIRAEDGRSVERVDISPFIANLPNGKNTTEFQTENASGSTSQATNIVESLEMGARCLLIDEDTSATNFMIRDRRMQELVATEQEPITPFIDRAHELSTDHHVSLILVIGGSGDYFDIADNVLVMKAYEPKMETERAKSIASQYTSDRLKEDRPPLHLDHKRIPLRKSFDPRRGRRASRVRTLSTRAITFGTEEIDVALISQLVDDGQTRTLGDWLLRCANGAADGRSVMEIGKAFEEEAQRSPLSVTLSGTDGDRVFVRRFELAAAINRLRSLEIQAHDS